RYINGNDQFYADGIMLADEDPEHIDTIFHPQYTDKKSQVNGLKKEAIVSKVFENGKVLLGEKRIAEISDYRKYRVSQLSDEHKRFEFPHIYKVGLSDKLIKMRDNLLTEINKKY